MMNQQKSKYNEKDINSNRDPKIQRMKQYRLRCLHSLINQLKKKTTVIKSLQYIYIYIGRERDR